MHVVGVIRSVVEKLTFQSNYTAARGKLSTILADGGKFVESVEQEEHF